jgi:hypothetical protein
VVGVVRECLMGRDPESLDEKQGKERRRDALREVEVEAAKAGKSMSHSTKANRGQIQV